MFCRMNNKTLFCWVFTIYFLFMFFGVLNAQETEEALFKDMEWRNTGPANMSGRVTDIQAMDDDFRHVLVASASGGVWKSTNAGTTWEPIFDQYGSASIGAVVIFPKNADIIWVGMGEANVRNSVGWGDGMYKSTDGGKTFTRVGLEGSHHIARIITHPEDPDIVYVAAQGHLWGYTGQRGLYKTKDFGRTWENITNNLPDGYSVYVIREDLKNKNLLFMGTEFGVFASVNGGKSWTQLKNGIPTVAVHDLLIHPRAADLIAGTHGRSVYILDDITPLQQFTEEVSGKEAHLFGNPVATKWQGISRGATRGHKLFVGRNPLSMSQVEPSNSPTPIQNTASINYYLKSKPKEKNMVEISNLDQTITRAILLDDTPDIGRYRWDMRFEPTEQQKKNFVKRLENVFMELQKQVDGKQKEHLDQLHQEFQKAKTTDGYNKILRTVMQEFRSYARDRAFFVRPLQGQEVGAGIYTLKMALNGESYSSLIAIRDDPMLTK